MIDVKNVIGKLNLSSPSLKASIATTVLTGAASALVDLVWGKKIKQKEEEEERKKNAEFAEMIADVVISKMGDK